MALAVRPRVSLVARFEWRSTQAAIAAWITSATAVMLPLGGSHPRRASTEEIFNRTVETSADNSDDCEAATEDAAKR